MPKRINGRGNCAYFECHPACHAECMSEGTNCPACGAHAYCAGDCDNCLYLKTVGDTYECGSEERINDLYEECMEKLKKYKELTKDDE